MLPQNDIFNFVAYTVCSSSVLQFEAQHSVEDDQW